MAQSTQPPTEPYARSPKDCADQLGIDVSTLYRHYGAAIRSGAIQTLKIGAARRIVWRSLLDYIESETARAA